MWQLAGRTALVTGAAKRIGLAVAEALANEGVNIVVHYRSSEHEAEQAVGRLRQKDVQAWRVQADLSDPQEAASLFGQACDAAGSIDIVINSASIFPKGRLPEMTLDDVAVNVQINALAPFVIGRDLARQDRDGVIVNFLDTRIVEYDAAHTAYHISKRMLFTLTRMMALEFAPNVRVSGVAPGLVLPPPGEDESYLQRLASNNPLQRIGGPQGVVDAALFLVKSHFVTGQVIFVDGGYHMKGSTYGC